MFLIGGVELVQLEAGAAEGPHHPDAGDVLLHNGEQTAFRLLLHCEELIDAQVEEDAHHSHRDHHADGDHGQGGIDGEHHRRAHQNHQKGADELQQHAGEEPADGIHVRCGPLDHVPRLGGGMPAVGKTLDMGVKPVPETPDRALAGAGVQPRPGEADKTGEKGHAQHGGSHDPQVPADDLHAAHGGNEPGKIPGHVHRLGIQDGIDGHRQDQGRDEAQDQLDCHEQKAQQDGDTKSLGVAEQRADALSLAGLHMRIPLFTEFTGFGEELR